MTSVIMNYGLQGWQPVSNLCGEVVPLRQAFRTDEL